MGLVVGSYLNVVIHRLPRDLSTVRPPSSCPTCGTRIRARDNIPLLGWLLLRGRCRSCGAGISARYPLVEALTAVLFIACFVRFGATPAALIAALLVAMLLALALIDAEHFLLPDRITLPGIVIGLAVQPWWPETNLVGAAIGVALGAGIILALDGIWYLLRKVHGFGLGDVKMLAMVGAFLGPGGVVLTLFLGTLVGSLWGLLLVATGRVQMQSKLPFGTFLAGGALVSVFWGSRIVGWYLGLL